MLVPSIDIKNGKAVQLRQGKELVLESDRCPIELAREFNRFGEIAVIDLDAAMGTGNNQDLIEKICQVADVRVGGGIRGTEKARQLLKAGARKLIFGTAAIPELLGQFLPEQVMVALDQRDNEIVDQGWQRKTGESLSKRAKRLAPYCGSFLSTFVEDEGGLGGMNIEKVKQLARQLPKPLTVAGGIANTEEIVEISKYGIDVQVGMALYTGRIDPIKTFIACLDFAKSDLIPTIVQDISGQVLMLAYSSPESLYSALKEGKGIYYSRSRQEVWQKGLNSGSSQQLVSCRTDCDGDSLLFTVGQINGACHSGNYSCFDGSINLPAFSVSKLFNTLKDRKQKLDSQSYSASLFKDRKKLMKKIVEETYEVTSYESKKNLRHEIADLIYFISVLAVDENLSWRDIEFELGGRQK